MISTNELIKEIKILKKEKNAMILAHYYELPEIQDIADFVGDSLALAQVGKESEAEVLVVCGVRFMAESGKILSPNKKVLIPSMEAGCPMADMVEHEALRQFKQDNPNKYIVSYVNTSAAVKSLTDVCVTSSNALSIVGQLEDKDIIFLPDRNLGAYINKSITNNKMDLWQGYCPIHNQIDIEELRETIKAHPNAPVLAHPECQESVLELADFIGSTSGILRVAKESDKKEFIIVTEEGILHPLQVQNPNKKFILGAKAICCEDMKKVSLNDLYTCLKEESGEIILDKEIMEKSVQPLSRMLDLSK